MRQSTSQYAHSTARALRRKKNQELTNGVRCEAVAKGRVGEVEGPGLRLHSLLDGGVVEVTRTAADYEELVAVLVERVRRLRGVLAARVGKDDDVHPGAVEGADREIGVETRAAIGAEEEGIALRHGHWVGEVSLVFGQLAVLRLRG